MLQTFKRLPYCSGMIKQANAQVIKEAAKLLRSGAIVAFPTETVYGLGANALDGVAAARIFEVKGRPGFNPLIVHVPDAEAAARYVDMDQRARQVAAHFWPGPLTLILPRRTDCPVSELCSAGLPTLAIRVPAEKTAQALLKQAGIPVAAPSANKSGRLSPTTPAHVADQLGDDVAMILAGGACEIGLESTVLDLSGRDPVILRPGGVTAEEIGGALGVGVKVIDEAGNQPKSPGLLLKHYAPSVPVRLNAVDVKKGEALLSFGNDRFMGMEGGGFARDMPGESYRNLSEDGDLYEAAANLFRMLHDLDRPAHKAIAVMAVPETGVGVAINDRLKRAAQQAQP